MHGERAAAPAQRRSARQASEGNSSSAVRVSACRRKPRRYAASRPHNQRYLCCLMPTLRPPTAPPYYIAAKVALGRQRCPAAYRFAAKATFSAASSIEIVRGKGRRQERYMRVPREASHGRRRRGGAGVATMHAATEAGDVLVK